MTKVYLLTDNYEKIQEWCEENIIFYEKFPILFFIDDEHDSALFLLRWDDSIIDVTDIWKEII